MRYSFENNNQSMEQTEEISENISVDEVVAETEEITEDYEDCAIDEVNESNVKRTNVESSEDYEDDYEDCAIKNREIEEEHQEILEEDDYDECCIENSESEEEKFSEEPEEKNSEKSGMELPEEKAVEIEEKIEEDEADEIEDTESDEKVEVENIEEENLLEEPEEKNSEKPGMELPEEKTVEIEEKLEEEKVEDDKVESKKEQESFSERLDSILNKEEISKEELGSLSEENAENLLQSQKEKEQLNQELTEKFEEVLSKTKGTEEYKEALDEYNGLKDHRVDLEEKIVEYEQQQKLIEQKSLELREAQIQKGAEAAAASEVTLAEVNTLQERYDQTYYNTKGDKTELASIRNDSCSVIKELSAEKDSIKQAMDAKMDEISEYVISNNMERYDTAHDQHYRQMSAEYNAMKESYDRIDYAVVKLDENNKAITEQLGDEYISMVELPPSSRIAEVNDGTDVPDETNYFIDEVKASEVLSPFKQGDWEQLTIQEQKQAIEKLADYNAEILGVEDKPRIIYYNVEDSCNFGGYSAKQNAIYINEYNMYDAAETADTISHEYRHKYQHERAEKLENERDLEFKEGFDNYIHAEDDYQGYKEQLVESDAEAYAQVVKDKISSYSEHSSENINFNTEQSALGADYTKLNPEKGAVFEKVSVDELPDDFEQKDRIKYKEVLEAKELDELRSVASVHYENGKRIGDKIPEFNTYKEHYDIERGHIEKVRVKSLEAADSLESHFSRNDYGGLYSSNIDRRTIEVMAIYHDTGMDGNIKAEDYETERIAFLSNEKFKGEEFEKQFRTNHSLESAIHALRDRDSISKLNVNVDEVALGCLVHSKSNSGLRSIASEADWKVAVERLQDRVTEFNKAHPNEQIYFDNSFLLNNDGSFRQEKLAEMRSEAIVLRIGDANGHDTNSRTSQNGKAIAFSLEKKAVMDELPSDYESKFESGDYKEFFLEVQSADVTINGVELDNTNDPKGYSRMFAVGEGNFQSLSCEVDDNGIIKQNFELCNGNAFPLSTQHCIEERLGEYKTAQPMEYTPVVRLGSDCSDEVYKSYLAFADKIERDYNVRMEVVR